MRHDTGWQGIDDYENYHIHTVGPSRHDLVSMGMIQYYYNGI